MAGKLIDIFQNCKCVNEEKHLAAGEVRSLAFGDNNTVMVVELGLHEVVSRKVIAKAEKQIADTYGLDRVMIEPRYNMPGELSNAYIKSLYDDMAYRMPSAKGLLDHRKWAFADGALQIPMDEVSEKHFANALRHLEARIQRELGRSCPVHAVRADAQDFAPAPEQEESREEILHKAVEQAAAAAAETPKPKKPRPAPQPHTGYQRPRAEKVREDDLIFGKLIQDPIVSVNEAIAAYDMVTIQGEVFFTDSKDIHSKKTGKDYVKIAFDMTDRTNSVRVSKFLAADKAGDTASTAPCRARWCMTPLPRRWCSSRPASSRRKARAKGHLRGHEARGAASAHQHERDGRHEQHRVSAVPRRQVGTPRDGDHRPRCGAGVPRSAARAGGQAEGHHR